MWYLGIPLLYSSCLFILSLFLEFIVISYHHLIIISNRRLWRVLGEIGDKTGCSGEKSGVVEMQWRVETKRNGGVVVRKGKAMLSSLVYLCLPCH